MSGDSSPGDQRFLMLDEPVRDTRILLRWSAFQPTFAAWYLAPGHDSQEKGTHMRIRRALATAATIAALAGGLAAAPASADDGGENKASAVCDLVPNYNHWDSVVVRHATAPFRDGPYAECDGTTRSASSYLDAYCRYKNSHLNIWYFTDYGWVYSTHVTRPNGEPVWCDMS